MRLIQVIVPQGERSTVTEVLNEEGIDYAVTEEVSDREYSEVISFPLPIAAVEPVLEQLQEGGLEEDSYTIVLDAKTIVSEKFGELEERYGGERDAEERIPQQEIRTEAQELLPSVGTYLLLAIISATIATAGLLLDSSAVVVGSMVIAPLIGPALATNIGTVINDKDLYRTGVKLQLMGFSAVVVAATLFALMVRLTYIVPPGLEVTSIEQIEGRLSPDFLSLAVAFGAGAAGALSLSSGVSAAIVGVMIAAALIPPMAAVGIGLAWELPQVIIGASILVMLNVLAVNLSILVVFWLKNYHPKSGFRLADAWGDSLRRGTTLVLGLLVISALLAGVTFSSFQTATSEEQIRTAVSQTLDGEEYNDLTLVSVQIQHRDDVIREAVGDVLLTQPDARSIEKVIVVIGRPANQNYPYIVMRLDDHIESIVGSEVVVEIRFIETVLR